MTLLGDSEDFFGFGHADHESDDAIIRSKQEGVAELPYRQRRGSEQS
jgi:hypothetical protein